MSKTRQRFSWSDVIGMAVNAQDTVAALARRVEIAGSLRRFPGGSDFSTSYEVRFPEPACTPQRTSVGDIDLVVQVDETNPWARQQIGSALAAFGWMPVREGELIASYAIPGRVIEPALDLYFATDETWGITLLVRTGSAAHNIRLAQAAAKMLPRRSLSVARGILDSAGRVIGSRTEDDCFHALGMRYLDPELREAPEFEHLVRAEGA